MIFSEFKKGGLDIWYSRFSIVELKGDIFCKQDEYKLLYVKTDSNGQIKLTGIVPKEKCLSSIDLVPLEI